MPSRIYSTSDYFKGGARAASKQVAMLTLTDSDFENGTTTYGYTKVYDVDNFDKCYIENQDSEYPTIAYIVKGNLYSLQNTSYNMFDPTGEPHLIDNSGECSCVSNGTFEGVVPTDYNSKCSQTFYIHSDGSLWMYANYPIEKGQATYKGWQAPYYTLPSYKFYKVCGRSLYSGYAPRYTLGIWDDGAKGYKKVPCRISQSTATRAYVNSGLQYGDCQNILDVCGRFSNSSTYYSMYIMLTSNNVVRLGQQSNYWFNVCSSIKYISCRSGGNDKAYNTLYGTYGLIDLDDYWVVGYMDGTSSSNIKTYKTGLQVKEITSGYFIHSYAIGLDGHLYYVQGRTESAWNTSPSPKMIDDGQWTSIACNRRNYGAVGIKDGILHILFGETITPLPQFGSNNVKVRGVQNFMIFKED